MDINDLVRELDALISQLVRARGVLTGDGLNVIPPKRGRRRTRAVRVSDAASAKIAAGLSAKVAAGLKARWAKSKKATKTAQSGVVSSSPKKTSAKKPSSKKRA
jgi:hypothetical protein